MIDKEKGRQRKRQTDMKDRQGGQTERKIDREKDRKSERQTERKKSLTFRKTD